MSISKNPKTITVILLIFFLTKPLYFIVKQLCYFLANGPFLGTSFVYIILVILIVLVLIHVFQLNFPKQNFSWNKILQSLFYLPLMTLGIWLISVLISIALRSTVPGAGEAMTELEKRQDYVAQNFQTRWFWMSVVIGPMSEELLCRAFGIQQLRKTTSDGFAILVTSIIFALAHFPGVDLGSFLKLNFIPLFFVGLALGVIFVRHGLIASIVVHGLINLVMNHKDKLLDFQWFIVLPMVGVIPVVLVFISQMRGKKELR